MILKGDRIVKWAVLILVLSLASDCAPGGLDLVRGDERILPAALHEPASAPGYPRRQPSAEEDSPWSDRTP